MPKKKSLKRLLNSPGGLQKIAQAMLLPLKRELLYDGRLRTLLRNIPCAKCKVLKFEHEKNQTHPFFSGNLEMLEWEYEQKLKS